MNRWRPTVDEERWLLLGTRWPEYAVCAPVAAGRGPWRASGTIARVALAALGLVIAMAAYVVAFALGLPATVLVGGLALIVAAEWLIQARGFWSSGIEEALWFAGALGIAFWSGLERQPELLIAGTALLAGLRLGNALLILAAALVAGWWLQSTHWPAAYGWLLAALAALCAGGREFRRPSSDQICSLLMVALPLAAYAPRLAGFDATDRTGLVMFALAALGLLAAALAWRRRAHAPLLCALACLGCVAHFIASRSGLPLYAKLLLDGALLLAVTLLVERRLRQPWRGIDAVGEDSERLALLQAAGAAALTPVHAPPADQGARGGGGGFAGGGSSERY